MSYYHAVLGIEESASWEEVKRAYRLRMKECHPDRFQNDQARLSAAVETAKALNHAFAAVKKQLASGMQTNGKSPSSMQAAAPAAARTEADQKLRQLIFAEIKGWSAARSVERRLQMQKRAQLIGLALFLASAACSGGVMYMVAARHLLLQ